MELGWPTFTRSSKVASVVVPSSRRMVYLEDESVGSSVGEAEDCTRLEKTMGTFCIVPRSDWSLRSMVIRVPGGRGSGEGSVRLR